MHFVSSLSVTNYRSIRDATFELSSYTPLVGFNNAGKTNILRALEWVFAKSSLVTTDFYSPEQAISVSAVISGITNGLLENLEEKHRKKITPFVVDESLVLRRTQASPGLSVREIVLEVFDHDAGEWKPNPGGIDGSISSLFPDPIFIGAMENATEDVGKFASTTTIGKLLREIMQPINERHAASVTEALASVAKRLSAVGDEKDPDLAALDKSIQTELERFFPGVSARIHVPTPEIADFMKGATVRLFEDGYDNDEGRPAGAFGHGAQRSVQMALLKCLSDTRRDGADQSGRTTLLLIDEPELYLHPQAVEMVRSSLKTLAGEGYQVAFTTHSANMIPRDDASNTLIVKRNPDEGTHTIPRLRDAVERAINDAPAQAETLFSLSNSNKILFCNAAIMAEGKTEQTLLPDIFKAFTGQSTDEAKLALIGLGGVDNTPNAMSVLVAMGIPAKSIVDLDFMFRAAITSGLLSENDSRIAACKTVLARLEKEGKVALSENGLPRSFDGRPAYEAFELLALDSQANEPIEAIHEEMKKAGYWVWKGGAIEAHLGLTSKTTKAHVQFVKQLVDPDFVKSLPDYNGIAEMCAWMLDS